ncbi:MAG: hypothetical protein QXX08_05210 [Candidatus Bathyarchaeia archaeon]
MGSNPIPGSTTACWNFNCWSESVTVGWLSPEIKGRILTVMMGFVAPF